MCTAALERTKNAHRRIMSLSTEDRQLIMEMPMQLLPYRRAQIITLPWRLSSAFSHKTPLKQQTGPAQETRESGTLPEVVDRPATATASAQKAGSNDGSPNSSTSKTPPTNESDSRPVANGSTKRQRENGTSPESPTDTPASDTKKPRRARQRSPKPQRQASSARSAQQKHILSNSCTHSTTTTFLLGTLETTRRSLP